MSLDPLAAPAAAPVATWSETIMGYQSYTTSWEVTGRRRRTSAGGGALLRSTAAVGAAARPVQAGRMCSVS